MVSSGFAAKGTTLLWNNYPVLELTNITVPIATADDIDITNHDSLFDYEEPIPGLLRGGDFEVGGNLLPGDTDGQVAILTDLQARTSRTAIIAGPAGKYNFSFTAYPKKFAPSAPVTGKTSVTIGFKVSGKSTFVTDASVGLTTPFFGIQDNEGENPTITPAPANAVYHYSVTLESTDTYVQIQPRATAGTIRVNGVVVVSGAWSGNITVAAGTTRQVVVEVRETDKTSKIYRVFVTRPV